MSDGIGKSVLLPWAGAALVADLALAGCGDSDGDETTSRDAGASAEAGADTTGNPGIDLGPPSPVRGRWWNPLVSLQGPGERPIDLASGRVGVWMGTGNDRRWLPGSGDAQGSFQIPEVPAGPFLLDVRSSAGTRRLIASPGEPRLFELGFTQHLQPPANRPPSAPNTRLMLNLVGLSPRQAGDLFHAVFENGSSLVVSPVPDAMTLGATTFLLQASAFRYVDGPGLGEHTWIVQMGRTESDDGLVVSKPRAAVSTREIKTTEGQTTTYTLQLAPAIETETVSADVRRSEFLPYRTAVSPAAGLPEVNVTLSQMLPSVAEESTLVPEILRLHVPEGQSDVQLAATAGDYLPADWIRLAAVSLTFPVPLELTGMMSPQVNHTGFRMIDRADRLLGQPIRPLLSPPRELRIEGVPASSALVQVGTTPTLSWLPPERTPSTAALAGGPPPGGPIMYEIGLRKLEAGPTGTSETLVATLTTEATSLQLPPELLVPGPFYRVWVTASVTERSRLAAPMRQLLPLYQATTVSAPFSP